MMKICPSLTVINEGDFNIQEECVFSYKYTILNQLLIMNLFGY